MKLLKYTITRKPKRKTVSIIIKPDKSVEIVAPVLLSDNAIARIAEKKKNWINNKINELNNSAFHPAEHNFKDGEAFILLGEEKALSLTEGKGKVFPGTETITVEVPIGLSGEDRKEYVKEKLLHFYMTTSLDLLRKKGAEFGQHLNIPTHFISIKDYKSRWGSCFSDGRIYFNWKIIMAPEDVIDYLVIHELCHLREPNHSKKYWNIVETIMPEWKEKRNWLRLNGHALTI